MIAAKTWREVRWMGIAYTLILELMLVPAIFLWPSLRNEAAALGRIIPIDSFKKMFAAISNPDSDIAYLSYMAVQMFFKGVNVIGISCAVLLGTGLIARERENLTLEFLLARPVARSAVLWNKFWVVALTVAVPIFLTSWSAIPLSWAIDENLPFGPVTLGALHSTVFVLGVLSVTVLFSALARSQVHTAFMVGAVVIVQVAIYFVQEIRVVSVFRLSDFDVYGPIMAGNAGFAEAFWGTTVWIVLAGATVYGVTDRVFRRLAL